MCEQLPAHIWRNKDALLSDLSVKPGSSGCHTVEFERRTSKNRTAVTDEDSDTVKQIIDGYYENGNLASVMQLPNSRRWQLVFQLTPTQKEEVVEATDHIVEERPLRSACSTAEHRQQPSSGGLFGGQRKFAAAEKPAEKATGGFFAADLRRSEAVEPQQQQQAPASVGRRRRRSPTKQFASLQRQQEQQSRKVGCEFGPTPSGRAGNEKVRKLASDVAAWLDSFGADDMPNRAEIMARFGIQTKLGLQRVFNRMAYVAKTQSRMQQQQQ